MPTYGMSESLQDEEVSVLAPEEQESQLSTETWMTRSSFGKVPT